jgi:hypothetical protein
VQRGAQFVPRARAAQVEAEAAEENVVGIAQSSAHELRPEHWACGGRPGSGARGRRHQRRSGPFGAIEPGLMDDHAATSLLDHPVWTGCPGICHWRPDCVVQRVLPGAAPTAGGTRQRRRLVRSSDPGQWLTTEETRISPGRSPRGRRCRGTGGTARPRRVRGPRPLRGSRCRRPRPCRARCLRRGWGRPGAGRARWRR